MKQAMKTAPRTALALLALTLVIGTVIAAPAASAHVEKDKDACEPVGTGPAGYGVRASGSHVYYCLKTYDWSV